MPCCLVPNDVLLGHRQLCAADRASPSAVLNQLQQTFCTDPVGAIWERNVYPLRVFQTDFHVANDAGKEVHAFARWTKQIR
jgi:hypothetical protein